MMKFLQVAVVVLRTDLANMGHCGPVTETITVVRDISRYSLYSTIVVFSIKEIRWVESCPLCDSLPNRRGSGYLDDDRMIFYTLKYIIPRRFESVC